MAFEQGDIPDKEDAKPNTASQYGVPQPSVKIIKEALDAGTEIHVYFPNTGPGEDIHLRSDMCHVWPRARNGNGLIYVMDGGVEKWLFPENALYIERHDTI